MPPFESLPYRPCVGMTVLNRAGLAFIGRRVDGPEHIDDTPCLADAAGRHRPRARTPGRRLCASCTRRPTSRSVERLGEIAEWLTYDIPREIVGQAWNGKYRGQKQKWYALRFTGDDSEIDIAHPGRRT